MDLKKVFLIQEIIPNYRVPVFRRIAQLPNIDLTVFYGDPSRLQANENLRNATDLGGFKTIKLDVYETGDASYRPGFIKHVLRERPDVVVLGGGAHGDILCTLVLCKLMGIRVLWFLGGVPYINEEQIQAEMQRGRLNGWFGRYNPRRWLMFQADGMVVYSSHAKAYFAKQGFPDERIWVAPNSPDTDALLKHEDEIKGHPEVLQELRKKYAPNGERIIFMLGRLNKDRNTDVLLDAFTIVANSLPDTVLILVGDGAERPRLENRVKTEGIRNVHFAGAIYDDAILAKYYLISDVFVTPGVASLAIKIAMTFGIPVVAADYGLEIHAIRDRENGFIVRMNDVRALANKLATLLQDNELRTSISIRARETIREEINIGRMIEGFRHAICAET